MADVNKVEFSGRVNFTRNFDNAQHFVISQRRAKQNKETGEWETKGYSQFKVKNFEMGNLVQDGDIVKIIGRFDANDEYVDKNGSKRNDVVIIAQEIEQIGKNNSQTQQENSQEQIDITDVPF